MAASFSLEGYLRICAWCKKINYNGEWIPPDQYFAAKLDHKTTHGICPVCLENVRLYQRKVPEQIVFCTHGEQLKGGMRQPVVLNPLLHALDLTDWLRYVLMLLKPGRRCREAPR